MKSLYRREACLLCGLSTVLNGFSYLIVRGLSMDLGRKLREALSKLTNRPYVDEAAVKTLIKEIQRVLISSDVNIKLVFELSKRIEERSLKVKKLEALSLREHVMKVVYEELTALMGESYSPRLDSHRILMCGLYGSGKTT
ncbi:TPA: hypothetical protein EYP38_01180, partial [Candidatus Micrarchaeota archaeon]|nr:hypothetical protein [Candidatus Micrarchaeota archaeon]